MELFGRVRNRILPFAFILLDKSAFKVYSVQSNLLVPNSDGQSGNRRPTKVVVTGGMFQPEWHFEKRVQPMLHDLDLEHGPEPKEQILLFNLSGDFPSQPKSITDRVQSSGTDAATVGERIGPCTGMNLETVVQDQRVRSNTWNNM